MTITTNNDYKVEINKISRLEWTSILSSFDDATIYQSWDYGSVRWGDNNLSHVVLKEGSTVIAACQVKVVKVPLVGGGIAYVKAGPMWQTKYAKNNSAALRQIVRVLIREYLVRRGLLLRIVPNQASDDNEIVYSILQQEGLNSVLSSYKTLILDLSPSIDQLRARLKKKWRKNLTIAEKNGLTIVSGFSNELFEIVKRLYGEMLSRKKFDDIINLSDLQLIQNQSADNLKMKIMICELNNEPVAARVVSQIGDVALDFIAATGKKGLDVNASYFLQWRMIEWLKSVGCRWYDLGGIDPQKNPGGYQFKSGIVGENERSISFQEFNGCQNKISSLAVKIGEYINTLPQKDLLKKLITGNRN